MPKMKSHSGAKKRFKKTGSGKLQGRHAYSSHILEKKSPKRKRKMGLDRTISKAGLPMTPSPANAQKILKVVQDASKVFGTTIAIENNVGVIRVPASATASNAAR